MSPDISRQFRGIEDLLESQQRQERISFLGSDVSPVIQVDPPSFDLRSPTLEDVLVTGPAVNADSTTVPAGSFRQIMRATLNHNDPVALVNVEVRLVRAADSAFIAAFTTFSLINNPTTVNIFGQRGALIPPGWFLRAIFTGLAGGQIARLKVLRIDRVLGLTPTTI